MRFLDLVLESAKEFNSELGASSGRCGSVEADAGISIRVFRSSFQVEEVRLTQWYCC